MLIQAGCRPVSFPGAGLADFETPLPHAYKVYRASAHHIKVMSGDGNVVISPKVVELGHNDDFIIAKQSHLRRRSPGNPSDMYEEPDPGVFSFWIIDLRQSETFGPLTEDEFAAKRKALEVPEAVILHDAYDYSP